MPNIRRGYKRIKRNTLKSDAVLLKSWVGRVHEILPYGVVLNMEGPHGEIHPETFRLKDFNYITPEINQAFTVEVYSSHQIIITSIAKDPAEPKDISELLNLLKDVE